MSKVVLVTGASRGVGAEVATQLAGPHHHVVVNFREKAKRADAVVDAVRAAGGYASAIQTDVSDEQAVAAMLAEIAERFGGLDVLVLNASGGLEPGADEDYPMRLNRDAQVRLARLALPLMAAGGRIVFVTSHLAHFHGRKPVPADYLPIATSKQAGEEALRGMHQEFEAAGITFVVVSGDMIEGSTMVRLFERRDPDAVAARRHAGDGLPSAKEFACAIVRATHEPHRNGDTVYVGGPDYLS
ncbi:SDR family oxidoreductase [Mycolicibacterium stellerae]|uniref:SDR family oxidoreductase n=1 Tax=Mycolicibacterium stellerae TaxID=2358193 RepID=UPI001F280639|nr:SDR family oxidoreductase [Mycolicibacterium stellerae]